MTLPQESRTELSTALKVKTNIERDPNVIASLQEIDFNSSFEETSQRNSSPRTIHKSKHVDIAKPGPKSESQDSYQFSEDDEEFLLWTSAEKLPLLKRLNPDSTQPETKRHLQDKMETSGDSRAKLEESEVENSGFRVPSLHQTASRDSFGDSELSVSRMSKPKPHLYHTIQLATQKPSLTEVANGSVNLIKNVKPMLLSSEQQYVLNQALNGVSLFYTGSAGTGKSVLLRSIIKALRNKHGVGIAVTASTGLAACNIGGTTLHSFAGLGLGTDKLDNLLKKLRRNRRAINKWKSTKVLIIDEISMIDGNFLDTLNEVAKRIRRNQLPFGGIQLIVCGDFYQLPPVVKQPYVDGERVTDDRVEPYFSFECFAWQQCVKETIILREVFRQKGDQLFIEMLNEMRNGRVSERTIQEFHKLERPLRCPEGIVPAELFATRSEVDRANNSRLNKIPGSPELYKAIDGGELPPEHRQNVLSNFLAPMDLFLKKGAQVMCIKNFDETLVNGSLGQVVDFMDRDTYLKANNPDSELPADLSDYIFDGALPGTGQALTTSGILSQSQLSEDEKENKGRKESLAQQLAESSKGKKYPLVRFLSPDGINSRTILVEPEQWTVEDENQNVIASRIQLPLILAWSLSIHKSQGQTLPKVKVDLRRVFENGQSYVALSRAVSRSGLQVLNFSEAKIMTHPKVVKFYHSLLSAEESEKRYNDEGKIVQSVLRAQTM